jgi:hypothetical protein
VARSPPRRPVPGRIAVAARVTPRARRRPLSRQRHHCHAFGWSLRSQAPQPRSGAPQAPGLTAVLHAEAQLEVPSVAPTRMRRPAVVRCHGRPRSARRKIDLTTGRPGRVGAASGRGYREVGSARRRADLITLAVPQRYRVAPSNLLLTKTNFSLRYRCGSTETIYLWLVC